MKTTLAAMAILLTVTLTACGSSDGNGDETPSGVAPGTPAQAAGEPATSGDLAGDTFTATAAKGTEITDQTPLTLTFEEDTLSVDAGCNSISGNYRITDGDIQAFLASTLMGCPPREEELEVFTSELLRQGAAARIDGDTLTLVGKNATSLTLAR
jgi:heat shock protein HslJ